MNPPSFALGNIPFYWRMLHDYSADRLGIPDLLPFSFSFRPDLQLVTQLESTEVHRWLHRVYQENANVGYLQEGHALSVPYGDEFLRFLDQLLMARHLTPHTAMEIGCGGIYLLRMLKSRGLEVCGVDPSPVSGEQARRSGIKLIADFYPSPSLTHKADVIFHHNVLEHVADPVKFLRAHHVNLEAGGLVVTAVPDCSEAIARGDISMMLHEHLVYFDEDSLASTLAAAGFEVMEIGRSRYGGVLFGAGRATSSPPKAATSGSHEKFDRFCESATSSISRFRQWVDESAAQGSSVGFYVPLRSVPYLAACGKMNGYRFFDDDPGIRGKYFAGINVPVENFDDLNARPVRDLMICSYAFGEKIRTKVRDKLGSNTRIALLHGVISPDKSI